MQEIPLEILYQIYDELDLKSKINLRQTNKYYYKELRIIDLYNIPEKYRKRLNDKILKQYKDIKYL